MIVRSNSSSDAARLVTPTMLLLWLVLATVPLWITRIGLYPYLGIEILIWSLYALAFNLVLGTAGLPSFGHGAYFGIGAYAFGLCQFDFVANLWICLVAAAVVAVAGRIGTADVDAGAHGGGVRAVLRRCACTHRRQRGRSHQSSSGRGADRRP